MSNDNTGDSPVSPGSRLPDNTSATALLQAIISSPEKQDIIRAVAIASRHSGPLPSPEQFQGYEEVLPGAADRILKMAENRENERLRQNSENQKHIHSMDHRSMDREIEVVRGEFSQFRWGQVCAFLLGVIALVGAFILSGMNPESYAATIVAAVLGTGGLGSLVFAFTRQNPTKGPLPISNSPPAEPRGPAGELAGVDTQSSSPNSTPRG